MKIDGKIVAVTGGGQGLGRAMVEEAARRGAATVAVIDLDESAAAATAASLPNALAAQADVGSESALRTAIDTVRASAGPIDVFISNAGIGGAALSPFTDDDGWHTAYQVNVMSSVYAARILLPEMLARGSGHLVSTASSNALTTNPIHMAYAVTKHAQLAVAEWLAMTYGGSGIEVTCFCPKGMRTPMLISAAEAGDVYAQSSLRGAVTPAEAAAVCFDAIESSRFMAVTHEAVSAEFARKATDYEAWVRETQILHRDFAPNAGSLP